MVLAGLHMIRWRGGTMHWDKALSGQPLPQLQQQQQFSNPPPYVGAGVGVTPHMNRIPANFVPLQDAVSSPDKPLLFNSGSGTPYPSHLGIYAAPPSIDTVEPSDYESKVL